ncbi:NAD(P)/FAD-dependent oxidoreductase [Pontibaca salina]|uniref:FAD-dependent oxidoreductase n=1 Tax=Pontibaca salina TaxID=2795731 RepID=A0A934HRD4_9RHOB|nr:FAD-dependent oxidoreductase [Pontibaca salina]MBI6629255.1 FAD-dependent oxidoreductase [Pontibaca salina]
MVDVTIRGAGIFGLSIAWVCARRGARVRLIDPYGPGTGASGGILGALAPHVPDQWGAKKAFQFNSLLMAEPFWAEVEATGGLSPGYGRTGRIQPIADEAALALAQKRCEGARLFWQGQAEWDVLSGADLGPWAPPSPTGYVVRDTLSARIHPRRACAALVAALGVMGVSVQTDAPDAGRVIWATGIADLERINAHVGRVFGNGVKGQAALLHYDAGPDQPQLYIDGLHFIPHADRTLAIGSTSERAWNEATATDAQLDDLIDRATAALPLLHGAPVIERWAGVRPRARSRAPVLGVHPMLPGQFIANGGFKIGLGMAPKIAQVMADLVLDDIDRLPDEFRAEASL